MMVYPTQVSNLRNQILWQPDTGSYFFRRINTENASQYYTEWRRLDNFGYNTLSELASALGVNRNIEFTLESGASHSRPKAEWGIFCVVDITGGTVVLFDQPANSIDVIHASNQQYTNNFTITCTSGIITITNVSSARRSFTFKALADV